MSACITLVTCRRWPEISASDRLYAEALCRYGVVVQAAPWNGPRAPFTSATAVVLRSNWDYHHELAAFTDWLTWIEQCGVRLFNPAPLVRWNLDKRYLLTLADAGVAIPPTRVVPPTALAIAQALHETGWKHAVLKPVVGASGHNVRLVEHGTEASALADVHPSPGALYLVQEFVPEIQSGELSCVFFDGEFSHAFVRRPPRGEFRVNSQYGGHLLPANPSTAVVQQACAVLERLPEVPLYARVDGVVRDERFLLMELELNEPALALDLDPRAADRFAAATMLRLRGR